MGLSNAERQARWRVKRDAEMERLRKAARAGPAPEALAEARKEIQALRLRVRELEADPSVNLATLSHSARERLEAAIRQHKRVLNARFDDEVRKRLQEVINDTVLPAYNREYAEYLEVIRSRKGIMNRATFNKIRRCLHPDSHNSVSTQVLAEGFNLFTRLERLVLDEKESPTPAFRMPTNYSELMELKRKVQAERRAKRAASRQDIGRR